MANDRIINKYIYGFIIIALGIFLFYGLKEFLNAFLGAVVFYALFKNFMRYLTQQKGLKRSVSAVIIIIISFVIVVLPLSILISMIYNKALSLVNNPDAIVSYGNKLTEKLNQLPIGVSLENAGEKAKALLAANIGTAVSSSLDALGSILMMYFFLYFLLINMNTMEAQIIHYLPFKRTKIMMFGRELVDQTYSNAIGVPLVAIAQGLCAYLAYRIAGVPDAGLLAILTGFASILPLIGTAFIWLPVSVFLLADDAIWQGVFVLSFSLIVLSNVDNLIRMFVSKRVGDVHPVITVLGVIIGLKFFGLPGLVFGPLLISYFVLLLKLYYMAYNHKDGTASTEVIKVEKTLMKMLLDKMTVFDPNDKKNKKPNQPGNVK